MPRRDHECEDDDVRAPHAPSAREHLRCAHARLFARRLPSPHAERDERRHRRRGFLRSDRDREQHRAPGGRAPFDRAMLLVERSQDHHHACNGGQRCDRLCGARDIGDGFHMQRMYGEEQRGQDGRPHGQRARKQPEHRHGTQRVERDRIRMKEAGRAAAHIPEQCVDELHHRTKKSRAPPFGRPVRDPPRREQPGRRVQRGVVRDDRPVIVDEAVAERRDVWRGSHERDQKRGEC